MTIFTFETTHYALWAEEVADGEGIPIEVIPAPPAARARCNIALETLPATTPALERALAATGIPYGTFERPTKD
jgi:hypothetical protein